jgi:hypothetical protein
MKGGLRHASRWLMPRGAWVALYYWSLMVVLALACAIPHRAIENTERTS